MCRCLRIQPSGFHAWQKSPLSQRAREDARQTELIRQAWSDSGKVYGYRKLHDDLLDQGSQFTSMDWAAFIRAHNPEHSMSRRGNCHDNAVAESLFSSLKRERIPRRTYRTREEARQDVFDYIEMFYNPVRKRVRNGILSPVEFERQQFLKAEDVRKTTGYSLTSYPASSLGQIPFQEQSRLEANPSGLPAIKSG